MHWNLKKNQILDLDNRAYKVLCLVYDDGSKRRYRVKHKNKNYILSLFKDERYDWVLSR